MSERRSFTAALRELDRDHQAERLRPGAVHRIARRLDAELLEAELPSRRRRIIPMVSFAAGAATVLAVFTLGTEPDPAVREDAAGPAPLHASWQVGGDNCHATHGEDDLVLDGRCRVTVPERGLVIESRKTTRLQALDRGVALLDGTAIFEVEPDAEGPSRKILVPGGTIEVTGTRFSVVVRGDEGHVDLLEGAIRFVGADGHAHEIEPGERHHFSSRTVAAADVTARPAAPVGPIGPATPQLDPEPTTTPTSTQPDDDALPLAAGERLAALAAERRASKPSRSTSPSARRRGTAPSSDELAIIVEQVTELRAQRKYRAAVSLLRGALAEGWDRRTREVLSYELGTILSTQLPDRETACRHWAEHREDFPKGRYARPVARAEERLGCAEGS